MSNPLEGLKFPGFNRQERKSGLIYPNQELLTPFSNWKNITDAARGGVLINKVTPPVGVVCANGEITIDPLNPTLFSGLVMITPDSIEEWQEMLRQSRAHQSDLWERLRSQGIEPDTHLASSPEGVDPIEFFSNPALLHQSINQITARSIDFTCTGLKLPNYPVVFCALPTSKNTNTFCDLLVKAEPGEDGFTCAAAAWRDSSLQH